MGDFTKVLKHDLLVEQFRNKPNIAALAEVFGEELQEIFDFFEQLRNERNLGQAVGKQLDGVGDIVVMTRMEAGKLAGNPIPIEVIDDNLYRKYLVYKILKNTCECTYPDIIKAFRMFWDKPLYYSESIDKPATMTFKTNWLSLDEDIRDLVQAPFVKAAGVGIDLWLIFEPVRLKNHQMFLLSALSISLGTKTWNRLNLQKHHLIFHVRQDQEISLKMRAQHRVTERITSEFARILIRSYVNNLSQVMYLNGRNVLDGSWFLGQKNIQGPALSKAAMCMSASGQMTVKATLTRDTMWRLDGNVCLGGRKKLNAKIERSEL